MWVALEKFNGDAPITKRSDIGQLVTLAHTLDKCIEGTKVYWKNNLSIVKCEPLYEGRDDVWVMGIERRGISRNVIDWYVLLEHEVYG